ncbi:hypothetical protein [Paraburkholderia silvatlantica]|uniref:Uncharacterized protein n=1 Tax=Paraburkholderia silvatlantica TaxID=321895 RepID=A0ABR6FMP9_9BURK|nr:hypothetical protein [Paraburkholderia silvatlantica]MBB2928397.1 hypothetical protein [Paraburkholderia silvatlantica]PVY34558.1 hypothetical protein C7411_10794 [Paraburkholderia silvatlantica]PXW38773.1 hypothetical protein C7413_10794 [Paraburkholderia silvatlantica]
MPIDPSIPLQVQQSSPFASMNQATQALSSLAQMKNIQQQGQMFQAETQNLNNQAQTTTQENNEWQSYANLLKNDPQHQIHDPSTGLLDPNKAQSWMQNNMPLTGAKFGDDLINHVNTVNTWRSNVAATSDADRARIASTVGSFIGPNGLTGTPQQIGTALNTLRGQLASDGGQATMGMVMQGLRNTQGDPQTMYNVLSEVSRMATPASTQAAARQGATSFVNNGAQTLPVASTGDFGQQPGSVTGPGINNQVGPEGRQTIGQNPLTGGQTVVNKDESGNITGVTNAPTQGVYMPQPGDKEALPVLQAERDAARQQFSGAGLQHTNNQIVLDNIDNIGATGPAGQAFRNIASAFGFNAGDAKDSATAYDMVGKGLERSALQAAQSMGPQTNAGLDAQIKANGSLSYTPTAIKQITRLNDAIVSGTQSYQPGLERAISANPSAGVFAKRQFDEAWGANFDPRIYEMYNAAKAGDTTTVNSIVSGLGGKDSTQFKSLMKKAANLQQLSNTGGIQ